MNTTIAELWEKRFSRSVFSIIDDLTVFIADDSTTITSVINNSLSSKGIDTEVFNTLEALESRLRLKKPDILILDYYFADTTSFEFIKKYSKIIPIIVMSSTENSDDINGVFGFGIIDFVPKPISPDILILKINNFVARIAYMRDYDNMEFFLNSLLYTVEIRDLYTRGHSERVSELSYKMARHLKLDQETSQTIKKGALLHDIGKIGVRDSALLKKGKLTDEEFEEIKSHTTSGFNICKDMMTFQPFLNIIRNHHEKLDGTGYPDGLKGGQIPIDVQIVSIADVYDALTSIRIYRDALPFEKAYQIMYEEYKKGFWDIELLTALREINEDL